MTKTIEDKIERLRSTCAQKGMRVTPQRIEIYKYVASSCEHPSAETVYEAVKKQILQQAKTDISNMMACMKPLENELVLYRNIKTKFVEKLKQGMTLNYLGFSSCSLSPHIAEKATYGSSGCTLVEIVAPVGTPAIRLDLMPDVQNEPDEVILAPIEFTVTKINNGKIYLTCKPCSN